MEWSTILGILTCSGLIELLRFLSTRKHTKEQAKQAAKQAAAEADDKWFDKYEHQLDRMNTQIEFKDKRIEDLNAENAAKERRFIEQTKRLRECQDREYKAQREIIQLTQRIGELELIIERHKCIKERCPFKEPATELTRRVRAQLGINPEPDELPTEDPQPELTDTTNKQ